MFLTPATEMRPGNASHREDRIGRATGSMTWRLLLTDLYGISVVAALASILLLRVWHVNLELGMNPASAKLLRNAIMCGAFLPLVLALRLPPIRYRGRLWIVYCAAMLLALGWALRLDFEFKYDRAHALQHLDNIQTMGSPGSQEGGLTWNDLAAPLTQTITGLLAGLAGFLLIKWFHARLARWHVLLFLVCAGLLLVASLKFDFPPHGARYRIWLALVPAMLLGVAVFLTRYVRELSDVRYRIPSPWKCLGAFTFFVILPMMTFLVFEELGIYLVLLPLIVSMFYMVTKRLRFVVYGAVIAAGLLYGLYRAYHWSDSRAAFVGPRTENQAAVEKTLGRVHGRVSLFANFWEGYPQNPTVLQGSQLYTDRLVRQWLGTRVLQVLIYQTIVRGGYSGLGVGLGNPQILSYAISDLIYSNVAEQLGVAGNFLVLLLFVAMAAHAFRIGGLNGQSVFTSLVARSAGVLFLLLWGVGTAGQLNIFLQTGIGIPFLCKSGSLTAVCLFMVGAVLGCEACATRGPIEANLVRETVEPKTA